MNLVKITDKDLLKEGYSYLVVFEKRSSFSQWFILEVMQGELTDIDFGAKHNFDSFVEVYELPK